jgi:hypothetical protein
MKVYLLWWRSVTCVDDYIIGVYSSREKAEVRRLSADAWDQRCMDIEEEEVL